MYMYLYYMYIIYITPLCYSPPLWTLLVLSGIPGGGEAPCSQCGNRGKRSDLLVNEIVIDNNNSLYNNLKFCIVLGCNILSLLVKFREKSFKIARTFVKLLHSLQIWFVFKIFYRLQVSCKLLYWHFFITRKHLSLISCINNWPSIPTDSAVVLPCPG